MRNSSATITAFRKQKWGLGEPGRNFFREQAVEARPETHTKRQATQQGCLPMGSLLGDGDKGTAVYGEEKNSLHWADCRAAKAEQKSLV